MPITDAVNMYKNKYITVGTLSKYWLSPSTWAQRRDRDLNPHRSAAVGRFSSQSSRIRSPYYSKVENKLY